MAIQSFDPDAFRDALEEADAAGDLAKDEKFFLAAYEAFRAQNPKAWRTALKRARLEDRCHLVCRWIRSKECFFLCLDLCGLPKPIERAPDPRALAEAIVRITADENAVKQLVQAVDKRDQAAFLKLADTFKLGPLCHFFCHWVCVVRHRLLCNWICNPQTPRPPDLGFELQATGQALGRLLAHKGAFDAAVAASNANDANKLTEIFGQPGLLQFCRIFCEWFCSWRCTLVCLTLCRQWPPVVVDKPLLEAREFALVTQRLAATQPDDLASLVAAVGAGDANTYGALVERLKLHRYCIQLCHWICSLRCRRFCIIVCPEIDTIPLFTHVGSYRVDPMWGDFQSDGTTTAGRYAFTRTITLRGILPDGTANEAYEYRFRVAQYSSLGPPAVLGAPQDVLSSLIPATKIGQLEYWYWNTTLSTWMVTSAEYFVNKPGAKVYIAQQFGPPLEVELNQEVKAGGWIEVPREDSLWATGKGRFVPDGNLASLDTTKLTNEPFDLRVPVPGLAAGDVVPPAKKAHRPVYKIFFEARKVIGLAAVSGNDRDRIAMSNAAYTYTRHIEWAGGDVTTKAVCSLDIAELIAPGASGCSKLDKHLHAMYTAYHPYLQDVRIWLEGNGVAAPLPTAGTPFQPLPPGADQVTSPAGGHDFNIASLKPCAYILWMATRVGLTEGWGLISDATEHDHIAFCVR